MSIQTLVETPKTEKPQKDLSIPAYHRRIVCFDTETNGLMPKHRRGDPFPPDSAYPHITQISWIVYNVATNKVEEVVNEYVKIPANIEISAESTSVSGITREIIDEKGVAIAPLLMRFFAAYMKCDCIVAHNLHFDGEVVRKEMWRNRAAFLAITKNQDRVNQMTGVFTKKFNAAYHIDTFCTMMNTVELCGLDYVAKVQPITSVVEPLSVVDTVVVSAPVETIEETKPPEEPMAAVAKNAVPRKKFPKLKELYCKLFDPSTQPLDLHNSIVDVLVCLRCFLKVRNATEMSEFEFQSLVNQYSRPEKI
jgi:DNA polymerase III epsilon subunit-like protein